jgi:hypothetical protein
VEQTNLLADDVLKQIDAVASAVAKDISKQTNREVKADAEGVAELDNWIMEVRESWDLKQKATMSTGFGAFLGTAIINEVGGHWTKAGDGEPMVQTECEVPYTAAPFSKVVKMFANGSNDSIMQMLDLLMGAR